MTLKKVIAQHHNEKERSLHALLFISQAKLLFESVSFTENLCATENYSVRSSFILLNSEVMPVKH